MKSIDNNLSQWLYLALAHKHRFALEQDTLHSALFCALLCSWDDRHIDFSEENVQIQQSNWAHLRLGFMDYIGYLDRAQDYLEAQHAKAANDTDVHLLQTVDVPQPSG
jgi:hypothetical protein